MPSLSILYSKTELMEKYKASMNRLSIKITYIIEISDQSSINSALDTIFDSEGGYILLLINIDEARMLKNYPSQIKFSDNNTFKFLFYDTLPYNEIIDSLPDNIYVFGSYFKNNDNITTIVPGGPDCSHLNIVIKNDHDIFLYSHISF